MFCKDFLLSPRAIEERSFEIIEEILKVKGYYDLFNSDSIPLVKRVIHATGDPDIGFFLHFSDNFLRQFIIALKQNKRIVADVQMVRAGIQERYFPGISVVTYIDHPDVIEVSRRESVARAYIAMGLALEEGATLFVVGNAPTALYRILEEGNKRPIFVVGTPVGFVGAAEQKEKLIKSSIPHVSLRGTKGGSTIAAALANGLLIEARKWIGM